MFKDMLDYVSNKGLLATLQELTQEASRYTQRVSDFSELKVFLGLWRKEMKKFLATFQRR